MTTSNHIDPFAALRSAPVAVAVPGSPASDGPSSGGAYAAPVNRQRPACILFVCDQSASMDESFQNGRMKAQSLADTVNAAIFNLVSSCTMSDGCRHYFDVGVIGYGGNEAGNALAGPLGGDLLKPITEFEKHPLRIEDRSKKIDDGAGGITETNVKFPVWIEPRTSGGTPMCTALRKAREVVAAWCASHPDSYPPTIIHVTDGQSTDGSPEAVAAELRDTGTSDGRTLLFNLHIASSNHKPEMFTAQESSLGDPNAQLLFRMSSRIPAPLQAVVRERGFNIKPESRFFGYNADLVSLVQFLQIGSSAAQMR
jgi:hypothetical protein